MSDSTKPYNALRIFLPETRLKEVFQIFHEEKTSRHRGVAGISNKFQRTFFVLSARDNIRLVERCDICPNEVSNPGCDLMSSFSETVRKNRYLLTVQMYLQDSPIAHQICNLRKLVQWHEF